MEYSDPSMLEEREGEDARRVTLASLVRGEKAKFLYEYDFGDSWDHELLNEISPQQAAGVSNPRTIQGDGGVPNVEICHARKPTSLCFNGRKPSELRCHLHF